MKLSFKQKRLVREKMQERYGADVEFVSIHIMRQKGYDKRNDASVRVVYLDEFGAEQFAFTKLSYLVDKKEVKKLLAEEARLNTPVVEVVDDGEVTTESWNEYPSINVYN